jgi:hypothetical protein
MLFSAMQQIPALHIIRVAHDNNPNIHQQTMVRVAAAIVCNHTEQTRPTIDANA